MPKPKRQQIKRRVKSVTRNSGQKQVDRTLLQTLRKAPPTPENMAEFAQTVINLPNDTAIIRNYFFEKHFSMAERVLLGQMSDAGLREQEEVLARKLFEAAKKKYGPAEAKKRLLAQLEQTANGFRETFKRVMNQARSIADEAPIDPKKMTKLEHAAAGVSHFYANNVGTLPFEMQRVIEAVNKL